MYSQGHMSTNKTTSRGKGHLCAVKVLMYDVASFVAFLFESFPRAHGQQSCHGKVHLWGQMCVCVCGGGGVQLFALQPPRQVRPCKQLCLGIILTVTPEPFALAVPGPAAPAVAATLRDQTDASSSGRDSAREVRGLFMNE